ncbi:protein patched-like [Planococcus citri]|uniref:protein patched-like n=1 Tax=Planococcus citri TaxID=170843 RepID=UPI0031F9CE50
MVLDLHQTDLYVRPSWLDAAVALREIKKGNAEGERSALWFRKRVQKKLFDWGCYVHQNAGIVLFVAILALACLCVGLKSAIIHSKVDQLWIEEGGRLERERKYIENALGESATNTHQLVIQTPKDPPASLLHSGALLAHLKVIKAASSVTVYLFNEQWRLKDICSSPSFSSFDMYHIDQIFRNIIPCSIITPLDCFWEGSKLLGPDDPVFVPDIPFKLKWTNLNPRHLLQYVKSAGGTNFPLKTLEEIMKRAGITTGYQEKPCLNPRDPECPDTAPNKNSSRRLDIGAQLTGGCYGFATKYMHWPEDLIIGAAKKNKTGHITKAHGLQTVIQLMSEKELYDYFSDDYKVQKIDWTPQKAALVLETWQRKFSDEVKRQLKQFPNETAQYNIFSFSTATLNDILSHFSKIDLKKIFIGYLVMLIFVAFSLLKWNHPVSSQTAVGIAGVLLVTITNAAALGFCALCGIAFNASTTQILPYLGLGFGVVDVFLLTSVYAEQLPSKDDNAEKQTGAVLRKGGLSVLLTSISNCGAFFAAALIPVPALRVFSMQAGILVFFNLVTTLTVFPAIISIDLNRRSSKRADILCCYKLEEDNWPYVKSVSPPVPRRSRNKSREKQADGQQTVTVLASSNSLVDENNENPHVSQSLLSTNNNNDTESNGGDFLDKSEYWSWDNLLERYAKFLCKKSVKVFTVVAFLLALLISVWYVTKVVDGLELSDIVPQSTNEHGFLAAQEKYFGFYDMYVITEGDFEYPTNQKLLYEYHDAFTRVPNIIKNDNGGLPQFWLSLFRDWLLGIQKAFDRDWANGSINQEGWLNNATDEGILGYKLLVQTGDLENPIDKSLMTQSRLVNHQGIISPDPFYNYLSAWVCHDALAYSASQANLKPEPKSWCNVPNDYDLKIPKSSPLTYTQIPFYLQGLGNTFHITKLISQVRDLCQKFEAKGVPSFPSGIPFLFWEQYQDLRWYLAIAILCSLSVVFCTVFLLLFNVWAAAVVVFGGAAMVLQLLGSFGILGIKLSAVPAVLLIVAVGVNVHFIIHTTFGFITAIGNRERRLQLAIKHMFPVILRVAFTILLAVSMLAFNDFNFIVRYFFYVLLILIGIGFLNGLLFFPMVLLLMGPPAEVKPKTFPDRICTPISTPKDEQRKIKTSCRQAPAPSRRQRDDYSISLTTISEEPGSWHSTNHEIVVEPELVVEATSYLQPAPSAPPPPNGSPSGNHSGNENESSCNSSPASVHRATPSSTTSSTPSSHVTTKVTATAKFKVEIHTPIHRSFNHNHHRHSRRRDSTSSTSTTSTECSSRHS